jgi:DNA-binding beta-propeller fold protein YncE
VGGFTDRTLTPINVSTLQPGTAIALPVNPTGMAASPAGTTVYVCGGASVVPVTVAGLSLGPAIALPDVAQGIALAAGGSTAWVTLQAGSMVSVTLASGAVGPRVHLGGHPSAIVIGSG